MLPQIVNVKFSKLFPLRPISILKLFKLQLTMHPSISDQNRDQALISSESPATHAPDPSLEMSSFGASEGYAIHRFRARLKQFENDHPTLMSRLGSCLKGGMFLYAASLVLTHCTVVRGKSMEPNVHDGDRILTSPFTPIDRFDVVTFDCPTDPEARYIKRVVGLPGETLEIKLGKLFIDDAEIEEPLHYRYPENFGPILIPTDAYFVLGDNRPRSLDSRVFGAVSADAYIEEVVFSTGTTLDPNTSALAAESSRIDWQEILEELKDLVSPTRDFDSEK